MRIFHKLRTPRWQPLVCRPVDMVDLFQELISIDAPVADLLIEYEGMEHKVGISSDYSREKGFFDTDIYFDEQHFTSIEEFASGCMVGGIPLMDLETVRIIRDLESGDPRNYTLLKKREIGRQ